MEMMIKGMLAMFFLLVVPACVGMVCLHRQDSYGIAESFMMGYLVCFSFCEILSLLMIYTGSGVRFMTGCYAVVTLALGAAGLICGWKDRKKIRIPSRAYLCIPVLLAVLVMLFLLYSAVRYGRVDEDDCFFVAAAATDVYHDSVFQISPYTGNPYVEIPARYALAAFPTFLEIMHVLSGGLHVAILAHTIFPVIFFLLIFAIYGQLAAKCFPQDIEKQGTFLLFTTLLSCFSAWSIYNSGTFQIVRVWQGKALLASGMVPCLIYFCICILMEKEKEYPAWFLLVAAMASCYTTSMGVVVSISVIGLFSALSLLTVRNWKRLLEGVIAVLPSFALAVLYLLLKG